MLRWVCRRCSSSNQAQSISTFAVNAASSTIQQRIDSAWPLSFVRMPSMSRPPASVSIGSLGVLGNVIGLGDSPHTVRAQQSTTPSRGDARGGQELRPGWFGQARPPPLAQALSPCHRPRCPTGSQKKSEAVEHGGPHRSLPCMRLAGCICVWCARFTPPCFCLLIHRVTFATLTPPSLFAAAVASSSSHSTRSRLLVPPPRLLSALEQSGLQLAVRSRLQRPHCRSRLH